MMNRIRNLFFVIGLGTLPFAPIVIANAAGEDQVFDAKWSTACGPIARHVALRALGVETPLADSVAACNWDEGKKTTLETIRTAIDDIDGISCRAVRMSPAALRDYLSQPNRVAILVIKKDSNEINHVVCAHASTEDGGVLVTDYPELTRAVYEQELATIWDGEVLIASHDPAPSGWRLLVFSVAPGVIVGVVVVALMRERTQPFADSRRFQSQEVTS